MAYYVKVAGQWKYLYPAVDRDGDTIDFLLIAKRDAAAARRFLERATALHGEPEKITIDKSGANTSAINRNKAEHEAEIMLRQSKYLNNIVEQDHRAIKRIVRPMLGFKSFRCARIVISGIETMHMIRKGQLDCPEGHGSSPARQFSPWPIERRRTPPPRSSPKSYRDRTCKSTYRLAEELQRLGHKVSQRTICDLLSRMDYSLQSTRKTREGRQHEDRDAQFAHIARTVAECQRAGDPVISVDTKKKEMIGDFKNAGKEWQPKGSPEPVRVHDFVDPELGKVAPYGVYDLAANAGWGNVGIDHDTAEFAVESIRRWWREMDEAAYPHAHRLLITADCGGSNGHRVRLWRRELQKFADQLHFPVQVCHFPPGTSKWNRIEHRMFCHITANWRGRPLISREVVVNLIGSTTTREGLRIMAAIDENTYAKGIKVTDEELAALAIERDPFHGEWNYRLLPRNQNAPS